jgi:uncharacterized protein
MGKVKQIEESDIIEWLQANPDLFSRHPELVDDLELSHEAGAQSLIERQISRLRTENRQLKAQLQTLAGIAGENERLMQRLHQLTLEIMTTDDTREFIERLIERLAGDFEAGSVRLHLISPHPELASAEAVTIHEGRIPDWFEDILNRGKIVFGRLTRAKLEILFPNRHESVGSAALVPVNHTGLLAIGSDSAGRFNPDMGTLFLELLGTTIRYRLELADDTRRKSA